MDPPTLPPGAWLGFPDASFGVVAYAADLGLDVPGGRDRADVRPRLVVLVGAVAGAMAAGSLVLVALQAVYGHWCSLCLVSAGVSLAIAVLVAGEVRTAVAVLGDGGRHPSPPAGDKPAVGAGERTP